MTYNYTSLLLNWFNDVIGVNVHQTALNGCHSTGFKILLPYQIAPIL